MVCVPLIWTVFVVAFAICLGKIQDPYFRSILQ